MQTLELKAPYLEKRNKLVIVCSKGSLDMAYPPLMLATTGAAIEGMRISVACPEGYEPNREIFKQAQNSTSAGGTVEIVHTPSEAALEADVLYTDVWVSMGDEASKEQRMRDFNGFQINSDLLSVAKRDASVMHCLPAHRGLEITDDVIEGKHSIVWEQGENKLYGAAAVLEWLLRLQ
ncbi:MAG TPA: hypothetical protein VE955_08675 [Candidatus Dormibacteraeota bacterium]|nr:hypothetical protein [Candidatus Dormibacteraeota bacterium]